MYCSKCGNEIKEEEQFCSKCEEKQKKKEITVKIIASITIVFILIIILFAKSLVIKNKKQENLTNMENSKETSNLEQEEAVVLASEKIRLDLETSRYEYRSPYVMYNNYLCRVLYDVDSEYGLQIITDNNVTEVNIGSYDFDEAIESYNNAINMLNSISEKYRDTRGIAISSRCVGTHPLNLTETNQMVSDSNSCLSKYGLNGIFKEGDENYKIDIEQMENIGILNLKNPYWLASRFSYIQESFSARFGIRCSASGLNSNNTWLDINNIYSDDLGKICHYEKRGFRPVFTISSEAKLVSGDGTKDNPYVLDI